MRTVKILLLLVFILLCGAFIYAKSGSIGSEDDYFNTHYRLKLDRYAFMRQVLALHSYGDARADYLGTRYGKILIEVDILKGVDIDQNVLTRFTSKVSDITGKPTSYFISDTNLPYSNLNESDVSKIAGSYRNAFSKDAANLYVLLADTSKEDGKQLGSTQEEYGIVLYDRAIRDFTADSSATYESYAFSTLLHEFGHQLGLEHNDQPGCLMNAKAETNDQPRLFADQVVTDFCPFEKQEIAAQKLLAR